MPMNTTATAPSANAIGMPENIANSVASAVADANTKDRHRRTAPLSGMMTCSRICTHNSVMPVAIRP